MRKFLSKDKLALVLILIILAPVILLPCSGGNTVSPLPSPSPKAVPKQNTWGIYELDLTTLDVKLIYSTPDEIYSSALRLNGNGDKFVFAQKTGGQANTNVEIYSLGVDGRNLARLTNNQYWDLYPVWSPDGARIAFLSRRDKDLDIYLMNADGSGDRKFYDSGFHDADIDWAGNNLVFTSQFAIWKVDSEGKRAVQVTNPPNLGQWGKANLPAGDYDPRLSPDGTKIVFERLEDVSQTNGGYNIFVINIDGTGETRLTDNGYAQGLASWSHSREKLVYVVAAISGEGKYDIYLMNADGSANRNITPSYFPADFLCHSPIFSIDDARLFFIGQWWQ